MPGMGHQHQLGWGEESVFGTPVAITKFAEDLGERIKLDAPRIRVPSIRGSRSRQKLQYLQGRRRVAGDVPFPFYAKGLGQWLKHAMGSVASAQQAATPAYLHTFTLQEALPTGLTIESKKGPAQFHKWQGCKVNQLTLEANIDDFLRMTVSVIGQEETISASGASATYPTSTFNEVLVFHQGVLTIGGTARNIRRFRLTIDNMLFEDYAFGAKTMRSLSPAGREITGEFLQSYDSATAYDAVTQYTAFRDFTPAALNLKFTGMQIDPAPHNNWLEIDMPVLYYDGTTPDVEGPEAEITLPVPFRIFKDVNPEIVTTMKNTEVSI